MQTSGIIRKRTTCCVATLLIIFAASFGFADPEQEAPPEPVRKGLIFAGDEAAPPYSFRHINQYNGYSVDLARLLFTTTNKPVTIKLMPWEKCLAELKEGTIDGLIGAPIYEKLEEYADCSRSVAEIDFAILVPSENTYVNSLKSLEGTVVGVYEKSLIVDYLLRDKRIKMLKTKSILEALYKMKNREITAIIAEKNTALYHIRQRKIDGVKIVGQPVGLVYGYALAVKKGETSLLESINNGIMTLEKNGTLGKLRRKWLSMRLVEPFPWKMVSIVIGAITGLMLLLMGALWAISLNATVKAKTRQIQLISRKMVEKDKLAVLGKLAGQIAHELRTPLSIIHNSVFLLRREGKENKELFEKRLRLLENKIKLTSNILESILSYSRVKAEVAAAISVKNCLKEVLQDLEMPDGIKTDVVFEKEDSLMLFMDMHQLYSVLRNLILNSVQAMGETGKLSIKAFPSEDELTVNICISDTGGGIMEAAHNKIFALFYSTKITGTGLGLPISKSIIEANNGHLHLENTDEKGSCFTITLPSVKAITG